MNKRFVKWLYHELSELVDQGIVPEETAENIRQYYGPVQEINKRKIALIVFSCFGAIFIGLGILLLLANNWSELSRSSRTILSMTLLLAAQFLTGWTLLYKKDSIAWRESASTFLMLSIGITISLICQTYHISGNTSDFILTWMVLGIPVVYLLDASLPILFYLIGMIIWSIEVQSAYGHAMLFWPLFALIIPHFWKSIKRDPLSFRSVHLSWEICLCLCIATGIVLEKRLPGLWIIVYASLFVVMFYIGLIRFDHSKGIRYRPFQNVGLGGIYVLSLLLSYDWPWKEIGWRYFRSGSLHHGTAAILDIILAVVLFSLVICYLGDSARKKQFSNLYIGLAPVVAVIAYLIAGFKDTTVYSVLLFNVYLFVLAVGTIKMGIQNNRLGIVNLGMLVMSALIFARFFDSSISFAARGLIFIMIGAGFLTANIVLTSRGKYGEPT
ncbi:MAG: DUF2157 domain-containing protein [Candidatus Omnitrophica bacterium]|nr:DUF2157 domain-containing protein [Candidatus Omnitrophota bacterium]